MIVLEHVNKVYDNGFHALKDINLEFKKEKLPSSSDRAAAANRLP